MITYVLVHFLFRNVFHVMFSVSMLIFFFVLWVLLSYIFIFCLFIIQSSVYALRINSLPIVNTFHLSKRLR